MRRSLLRVARCTQEHGERYTRYGATSAHPVACRCRKRGVEDGQYGAIGENDNFTPYFRRRD